MKWFVCVMETRVRVLAGSISPLSSIFGIFLGKAFG